MATKFKGYQTPEEYAADQEKIYQRRRLAITQQMLRDSRPIIVTWKVLAKFVIAVLIGSAILYAAAWLRALDF